MEHFTKGLRGAAGMFGTVGSRFGLFTPKQDEGSNKELPSNIEYVDEMDNVDHLVPKYYPDLYEGAAKFDSDEEDDFLVIESAKISPVCPYYYLPFGQSVDLCNRKVKHWLEQTWFLPSDWQVSLKIHPPKPQYIPFFVFDIATSTNYAASVLLESKDAGSPGKKWEPADGNLSSVYNEIIACGSCSVNPKLIQNLLDQSGFSYHSQRILPPDPRVFKSAALFEEPILPLEITKDEAWELSRLRVHEWEEAKAREAVKHTYELMGNSNDKIRNLRTETSLIKFNHFVILLPIYFAGFEYSSHHYEVLVSGNLGVVVGNRPHGAGAGGKYLIDKIKSVGNLVNDTI